MKICSLEGRLRGALPPSFFWRNQRPRVSVREIASRPTQTQALGDERTHHKLHQADPKRLRGQVESGGTDGGGGLCRTRRLSCPPSGFLRSASKANTQTSPEILRTFRPCSHFTVGRYSRRAFEDVRRREDSRPQPNTEEAAGPSPAGLRVFFPSLVCIFSAEHLECAQTTGV